MCSKQVEERAAESCLLICNQMFLNGNDHKTRSRTNTANKTTNYKTKNEKKEGKKLRMVNISTGDTDSSYFVTTEMKRKKKLIELRIATKHKTKISKEEEEGKKNINK